MLRGNKMEINAKQKMPILFVGHGSPINAVEDNTFTMNWAKTAEKIPKPKAILSVSAHWFTEGTRINDLDKPEMIYDMYGFPRELYELVYAAPGAPQLAHAAKSLIGNETAIDNTWGLDHGTWSVLCHMYPHADIPVCQLGIDALSGPETHFEIGRKLSALREQGVLILGSGNIVHNLSRLGWEMQSGYPWAVEFDGYIRKKAEAKQYDDILHYTNAGECSRYAFVTPEHFYPFLYVLGAAEAYNKLTVFNDACVMGSISMTSYLFE